ncbi:MAG: Rieske 2Fe-2S domain-containing protein [Chloroflexi bacterium]|nr:Rieske 2Fe-2S domain-containing protein [Chloroflexota bacterium]
MSDRLLVDAERGIVSRRIFVDPAIYEQEQRRVFRRSWLFVGHDSLLPKPSDFMSNYMGEDPVIVWRGGDGQPRVFLNTCPHRGNKLCLYDRGHAAALTCSYHGWTFDNEGRLTGVPFDSQSYEGKLDRASNGLFEPRVATYGGLIFASWEPEGSLDDYLGEMRWWLDLFVCHQDFGGMAVIPSAQKYRMPGNWKLTADNFIGDFYHVPMSHSSFVRQVTSATRARPPDGHGVFNFLLQPAHGVGSVPTDDRQLQTDLRVAERIGPEASDWVRERDAKLRARAKSAAVPSGFSAGALYPNMTFQGNGAFEGELVALAHPRGPYEHEVWQWLLFERDAPEAVRRYAAAWTARRQSAGGLVGVDDGENFDRIAETMHSPMAGELTFNYAMALERDNAGLDFGGQPREWHIDGIPGVASRGHYSEVNQRAFYGHWAKQMGLDGAPA